MVVVLPIFSPNEAIPWLRAPTILPGIAGERLLFLFLVSMKDDSRAGESVKLLQSTEDTDNITPGESKFCEKLSQTEIYMRPNTR